MRYLSIFVSLTGGVVAALRGSSVPAAGLLREACLERSHAEACERLGDELERGEVAARFPEEPGLFLALACEKGRADACDRAQPWARRYADYELLDLDVGCSLRANGFACEELAEELRDEQEVGLFQVDPQLLRLGRARMRRALELDRDGCQRGDAAACLGASRVYRAGFGVPYDLRAARASAARACELGLGDGCEVAK